MPGFIVTAWSDPKADGNMCLMPKKLGADHTRLYRRIRALHCDRKKESHECSGRMVIDRNGVTLTCPLCGMLARRIRMM